MKPKLVVLVVVLLLIAMIPALVMAGSSAKPEKTVSVVIDRRLPIGPQIAAQLERVLASDPAAVAIAIRANAKQPWPDSLKQQGRDFQLRWCDSSLAIREALCDVEQHDPMTSGLVVITPLVLVYGLCALAAGSVSVVDVPTRLLWRACGRDRTHRPVTMAMFAGNAHKIHAVLEAINPKAVEGIVALGRVDSMLRLDEALESGAFVGVLADRAPEGEKSVSLPFLGEPALFPTGPMRLAAVLRRPVVFMAGLYLGGNRYEVRFKPLADFSALPEGGRAGRDALVHEAIERYARCLERNARRAPYNWFNFHDFWAPAPPR